MTESKSKTKKFQDAEMSEEKFREMLAHWDYNCVDLNFAVNEDPNDVPYVALDVSDKYGFEAHLFTAADMALWLPEILPSGHVVLYHPNRHLHDSTSFAEVRLKLWDTLSRYLDWITHMVRAGRSEYGNPSSSWAHCEREEDGYFEIPENEPQYIEKILKHVDGYLPDVILELNRNGFVTIESCSGLKEDHEDRRPFEAYVCFDDEYYLDVSAHLFTLAEVSGWDPTFGAHGFDVLFYAHAQSEKEVKEAWDRLADMAGEFGVHLEEYRELVDPWDEYYYYQFRSRRGLFSQYYDEESQTLSGFEDELDLIDSKFNNDEEEK